MNNSDIIEVKHIYIVPIETDYVEGIDGNTYYYFQVQDENHSVIDEHDFVGIYGEIRQDIENGIFRYFPKIGNISLYYDLRYHYVLDKNIDIFEDKINKCSKSSL